MWGISCCVLAAMLAVVAWAAPHHGDHRGHHGHHDHHGHTEEHYHHLHHGPSEAHAHAHDEDHACHLLSPHNADFAFALYRSLLSKPDTAGKNIFYSPVGITTALSLLSMGARGDTHSQLFTALGYEGHLNQDQVNDGYEHLLHMLEHHQDSVLLDLGSALAIRHGFKPNPKFVEDAKHFYSAEGINVDFSKPLEAVAEINSYIAKKTKNKITDLVKDLDTDTAMVLINHVFFRGKWDKPFDATLTHQADFHVDDTTTVKVNMMKRTGRYDFHYDNDNHTSIIMLPYKGNTSMMIVLPDEGKMSEVEGLISKEDLKRWHDETFRSSVELFLPKFSISASASLKEPLVEMGVTNAFGDSADFAGISEEIRLKVSKVSHKAVLSVDETGTEAAAATTIEILPMSLPQVMQLNRPFLVFILEHSTKSILFMGKIANPTAQ